MSELSKLLGKSEKVKIGEVEFNIKPLTVDDLDLVGNIDPDKPDMASLKKLVVKVLRDSFPDATDEEIKGFPIEHVNELATHIARINNFKSGSEGVDAKVRARMKR